MNTVLFVTFILIGADGTPAGFDVYTINHTTEGRCEYTKVKVEARVKSAKAECISQVELQKRLLTLRDKRKS